MERHAAILTFGLTKDYGRTRAVDNLSLDIREGEIFGFLGPNGAGKTTTILMLMGLTRASAGSARVCGLDPSRQAIKIKRRVGYLPENPGFYPDLTAPENLQYIADMNRIERTEARRRIDCALDTAGIARDEARWKRVGDFSRGMKQRLGIAEMLIKDASVFLLDEPTLGLDPDATHLTIELIRNLSKERGYTVLLSSHQLEHVQRISDRIGIMVGGKLAALGSIDELAGVPPGTEDARVSLKDIYMECLGQV